MSETKTPRRTNQWDDREAMIRGLIDSVGLRSWAEFVEAVDVPADLAAALATGRKELLALARPRAMDADEVARLYRLIGVLIDTNLALQAHARECSAMVEQIEQNLRGTMRYALKAAEFAAFRVSSAEDDSE